MLSIAARFPLGLFNNLLVGQQRFDLLNLANFVATVLYALLVAIFIPHGGGLILLGALTLVVDAAATRAAARRGSAASCRTCGCGARSSRVRGSAS